MPVEISQNNPPDYGVSHVEKGVILKLSTRIIAGYSLILLMLGVVTIINWELAGKIRENSEFLLRSESIIRNSAQYQRQIVDMENNFRGYLITGNNDFLRMYNTNAGRIPALYDSLQDETADSSLQTRLLTEINALYKNWKDKFAAPVIALKQTSIKSSNADFVYDFLDSGNISDKVGKNITDLIRGKFMDFNKYEYHQREQRREQLNNSVKHTRILSFYLTVASIIIGLMSAIFTTRFITKRINLMVDTAEKIASGNLTEKIIDNGQDEMTRLSHSLNIMAERLEENISDLKKKNADLNQFAYIVSHDLKAPLRGIEMVLNWINEDRGDTLDEKVKEYHAVIRGRLLRMENLINGILEISRLGRNIKSVEEVNIADLLDEIIDTLSPPPEMKIIVNPGMPVISTEKILIEQVFTNLIGNAIKYHDTKKGKIEIGVQDKESYFEFYVKDDGPGIEKEYHEKIFEIFQTLKERDAFESTGIGLTIVKKIIEEKGGYIKVDSETGKGAVFTFSWPKSESTGSLMYNSKKYVEI
jgi:signal transduction histidine kinase